VIIDDRDASLQIGSTLMTCPCEVFGKDRACRWIRPTPGAARAADDASPAGVRGQDWQAGSGDQPGQHPGLVANLDDRLAVRLQVPADAPPADGQLHATGRGSLADDSPRYRAGVAVYRRDDSINHIPGTPRRCLTAPPLDTFRSA
jgi:hypothetical protein